MTTEKCIVCNKRATHAWVISTNERGWNGMDVLKANATTWCDQCESEISYRQLPQPVDRAIWIREKARGTLQEPENTQENLLQDPTEWFQEFSRKGF